MGSPLTVRLGNGVPRRLRLACPVRRRMHGRVDTARESSRRVPSIVPTPSIRGDYIFVRRSKRSARPATRTRTTMAMIFQRVDRARFHIGRRRRTRTRMRKTTTTVTTTVTTLGDKKMLTDASRERLRSVNSTERCKSAKCLSSSRDRVSRWRSRLDGSRTAGIQNSDIWRQKSKNTQ